MHNWTRTQPPPDPPRFLIMSVYYPFWKNLPIYFLLYIFWLSINWMCITTIFITIYTVFSSAKWMHFLCNWEVLLNTVQKMIGPWRTLWWTRALCSRFCCPRTFSLWRHCFGQNAFIEIRGSWCQAWHSLLPSFSSQLRQKLHFIRFVLGLVAQL